MPGERTRFIKIRVSEEDYQALDEIRQKSGTATVADLARDEMYHLVNAFEATTLTGADVRLWIRELICRLTSLQAEIERLEGLLKVQR